MRITNNTINQRVQQGLQRQLAATAKAHERILTGQRINVASDDPAGAADVMGADTRLRALTQYRRNIESAQSRLTAEEGVLDQLTNVLTRALELATGQGSDTANATTRAATKLEVDELLATAIQLANTQFSGRFIFGGMQADTPPVLADGTFVPDSTGDVPVTVERGQSVLTTHDARSVFGDTGVITALQQLSQALGNGDGAAIRSAGSAVGTAIDGVQDRLGEVGARLNRLDIATANIDALSLSVQTFRSSIGEADFESAITELVNRQTSFQAALMATSRILSNTLTDYLR